MLESRNCIPTKFLFRLQELFLCKCHNSNDGIYMENQVVLTVAYKA